MTAERKEKAMDNIGKYARIAKLLSLIAVILVLSPFIYAFTATGGATLFDLVFSIGAPTLFISVGYLLQALAGKVNGFKRRGVIFEDEIKYFDMSAALLPILVSVISALPIHFIYKAYRIAKEIHIDMYDLDLYLVPVVCSAIMIFGVVLWFLPYHKLMHRDMIYAYGSILLADFVISLIFEVSTLFVTVATVIFLAIFFTVSNLRSIEEALSVSKFRVPSNNFRSYNIKLTLKHYAVTIVSALVILSLTVLVLSFIDINIKFDPEQTVAENIPLDNTEVTGTEPGIFKAFSGNRTPMLIFSYVTIAITLISILLWFIRQKHLVRKFLNMIKMVFAAIGEFIEFLLYGLFEKNNPGVDPVPDNYVDREIECFTEYREFKVMEELDYRSFTANLDAKESLEEKYAYAYSVYTRLIRGHKYGIKASDTPRMITAKLSAVRRDELNNATPVFEDIRYRVVKPDDKICEEQLKELIALVRQTI